MSNDEASTFRTRSLERDRGTDMERRKAIAAAIDEQRRLAQAELEGLTRRMDESFGHVAFALDAAGDYEERDPAEESEIGKLEAAATTAQARIATLRSEIALMDELKAKVTG